MEIDGREVKIGRILSVADRFEILPMDLTGAMGGEEVRTRVRDGLAAENLPKETALRVILRGEVGADCHPDAAALSRLGESFALFEVRDETLPVFNAAYLEKTPVCGGPFTGPCSRGSTVPMRKNAHWRRRRSGLALRRCPGGRCKP